MEIMLRSGGGNMPLSIDKYSGIVKWNGNHYFRGDKVIGRYYVEDNKYIIIDEVEDECNIFLNKVEIEPDSLEKVVK